MSDQHDSKSPEHDEMSRRDFVAMTVAAGIGVAAGATADAQARVIEMNVEIKTPDGTCDAAFFHPMTGASPAVIVWPDAFGLRPSMRDIGRTSHQLLDLRRQLDAHRRNDRGNLHEVADDASSDRAVADVVDHCLRDQPVLRIADQRHHPLARLARIDEQDQPRTETARLAGHTLIWPLDDLTLRLEGDLTLERAVEIGASATPYAP